MKNVSKGVITVLLVLVLGLSFSGLAFAHKEHKEAFTKLLNNSAKALQASRPDLAAGLTQWSNEEANEKEEKGEKKELEGKAEKEMHAGRAAHMKLLQDSAAALKTSDPGLSADLTKKANRMTKKIAEKKEGKEDTKEAEEKEEK